MRFGSVMPVAFAEMAGTSLRLAGVLVGLAVVGCGNGSEGPPRAPKGDLGPSELVGRGGSGTSYTLLGEGEGPEGERIEILAVLNGTAGSITVAVGEGNASGLGGTPPLASGHLAAGGGFGSPNGNRVLLGHVGGGIDAVRASWENTETGQSGTSDGIISQRRPDLADQIGIGEDEAYFAIPLPAEAGTFEEADDPAPEVSFIAFSSGEELGEVSEAEASDLNGAIPE